MRSSYLALIFAIGTDICPTIHCQTQTAPSSAAAFIQQGKADMERGLYAQAEFEFRKATLLEPESPQAYLLLARALLGELPPNLKVLPDVQGVLPKAEEAINRAVALSPENAEAVCVQGIVSYKTALTLKVPEQKSQRMDQARTLFERALAADPKLAEAHVELARMAVDEAMDVILGARLASTMKIGQSGPIADMILRRSLRAKYEPSIEYGLTHAREALNLNARYGQAMSQMAALILLRANLRETDAEFAADMKEASKWQQQDLALRSKQPQTPPNQAGGVIGGIIGSVPSVAPPKR